MPRRIDPEAAAAQMRAAGVEPLEPYPGAAKPWRVRCGTCGETVTPRLRDVRRGTGACWPCGMRKRAASKRANNAATAYDEMRAAGVEPLEEYPGGLEPWRGRCLTCGEIVNAHLAEIRRGRGACLTCARAKLADTLRLDEAEAVATMRAAGVEPLEPYKGTSKAWRCRCLACGTEGTPSHHSVRRGQGACYACGKAKMAATQAVDPDIAAAEFRAAGVEPLEEYDNSHTSLRSRCTRCEREVAPTLSNIRSGASGCRYCVERNGGYDTSKPGAVYLVEHDDLDAYKVGVTGADSIKRLLAHERNGWRLVDVWYYDNGADALAVETAILDAWRGLPRGATRDEMPHGGHTETVRRVDVCDPVAEILAVVA